VRAAVTGSAIYQAWKERKTAQERKNRHKPADEETHYKQFLRVMKSVQDAYNDTRKSSGLSAGEIASRHGKRLHLKSADDVYQALALVGYLSQHQAPDGKGYRIRRDLRVRGEPVEPSMEDQEAGQHVSHRASASKALLKEMEKVSARMGDDASPADWLARQYALRGNGIGMKKMQDVVDSYKARYGIELTHHAVYNMVHRWQEEKGVEIIGKDLDTRQAAVGLVAVVERYKRGVRDEQALSQAFNLAADYIDTDRNVVQRVRPEHISGMLKFYELTTGTTLDRMDDERERPRQMGALLSFFKQQGVA
jgi:hypothetical protein